MREAAAAPTEPPAAPARAGRDWRRALRIAFAWALALAVLAAVGLYPLWSARLAALVAPGASGLAPSAWLTGGPTEPIAFAQRPVWVTPQTLAASPETYRDRLILIAGTPVEVGAEDGVSLASFGAGDDKIVVGYAGSTTAFAEDRPVSVAGVLGPAGDEVLALAVAEGLPGNSGRTDSLARLTLIAAAAFAAAALLVRVRRGRDRRRRRAVVSVGVVTALTLPLLLGGCEIVIRTEVARDGSGMVRSKVITGEDTMSDLMDLPNAESFIESWIELQGVSGVAVTRTTTQLKMDRTFKTLEEFGAQSGSAQGSWSRLGAVDLPDGRHMFFVASIDTSSVYPDPPAEGADTAAYDKLTEEIGGSTLRYELVLPGAVRGSNADGEGSWELPMGGRRFLFAESLTGASDADSRLVTLQQLWSTGVRWLAAAAAALFAFGVAAYPWRARGGVARG